jgi:plastocyanin
MRGKVTVLPKKVKVPSGASQKARAAREVASDLKAVRRTIRQARAATRTGTQVQMPGRTRLSILNFFPKAKTVAPGTVVTFRMTGREEFHTVTFGPPAFLDGLRFEVPPGTPIDPQATYPTDPPGPTPALSPTSHGNGFLNSGILTDPGYPLQAGPHSFRVRFDTPGDYDYRCLLHPDMRGRISVA